MANFYIRVGDTLPVITANLSDAGGAIDLTGCTIELHIEGVGIFTGEIVGDPIAGNVQYQWQDGDLANAGNFPSYWRVIYPTNARSSFPNYEEFFLAVASE